MSVGGAGRFNVDVVVLVTVTVVLTYAVLVTSMLFVAVTVV